MTFLFTRFQHFSWAWYTIGCWHKLLEHDRVLRGIITIRCYCTECNIAPHWGLMHFLAAPCCCGVQQYVQNEAPGGTGPPHTLTVYALLRLATVCTGGSSGTRQSSTLTEDAGHLLDTCTFSRCRRPCLTTWGLCHADSGMRNHINTDMSAGTVYYRMNTSTHLHKQKYAFLRPLSQLAHTRQGRSHSQTFNTWQKTDSNGKHCRHLYREFSMWRHDQLFIIDHVEKGENRTYRYVWSLCFDLMAHLFKESIYQKRTETALILFNFI